MKIYVPMALAVLIVVSVWGRAVVPAALPPAVHADTETVTNVPFATALDAAGRLSFDLVCRATPSNNVEVAFGTDANGNGVLEPEETDRVVGWDCGSWFTRKGADGACQMENGKLKMVWSRRCGRSPGVCGLGPTARRSGSRPPPMARLPSRTCPSNRHTARRGTCCASREGDSTRPSRPSPSPSRRTGPHSS